MVPDEAPGVYLRATGEVRLSIYSRDIRRYVQVIVLLNTLSQKQKYSTVVLSIKNGGGLEPEYTLGYEYDGKSWSHGESSGNGINGTVIGKISK